MWFYKRKNIKLVLYAFYAICTVLLLSDLLYHRHAAHPWESLFGFHAFYGLVACIILVLVAKEMRKVLMRAEDYYEDTAEAPETKAPPHGH
jgi:hypothetical protein